MHRILLPALLALSPLVHAERLSIDRIYADPDLNGPSPRVLKIAPDGSRVAFLRGRADDQNQLDLWQYEVATGAMVNTPELTVTVRCVPARSRSTKVRGTLPVVTCGTAPAMISSGVWPSIETTVSPRRTPAASTGEPGSTPRTRSFGSHTASASAPIRAVPTG